MNVLDQLWKKLISTALFLCLKHVPILTAFILRMFAAEAIPYRILITVQVKLCWEHLLGTYSTPGSFTLPNPCPVSCCEKSTGLN